MTLRRFEVVTKTDNDAFGAYLHMGGRIGVLTVLEGTTDARCCKRCFYACCCIKP